jgi:hypothetical protein
MVGAATEVCWTPVAVKGKTKGGGEGNKKPSARAEGCVIKERSALSYQHSGILFNTEVTEDSEIRNP